MVNLKFNKSSANLWSKLGSRATYGQAMLSIAKESNKILAMSADLGNSSGLAPFIRNYPDKFINVGIAEQNMIGVASGLAKEGFTPYVSSFAPFLSMRASEQIRMELGYMKFNVRVVALGSGLSMSFLGNSHFGLEDIAIMRAIPNITIVSPADCSEIVKVIQASVLHEGPMYIRLTGAVNNPPVYFDDYNFKIGKAINLKKGTDITIIATGSMVYHSLQASEILESKGISCEVINMHTLKPIDVSAVKKSLKNKKLVVTVEEHTIVGGLGSALSELKAEIGDFTPQLSIGLPDKFGKTAEYNHLLKIHKLTGSSIAQTINKKIKKLR
jgi:transketolase